jgi:hypothetical protein
MNVVAKSIPSQEHRYPTCGDYWMDENGIKQFRVSEMNNDDYHFLVFIHELIEEHLTSKRGIKEPDIKAFDEMFEKEREQGLWKEDDEPGFDPRAPYKKEHFFAESIERIIASELGIDWVEYEKKFNS